MPSTLRVRFKPQLTHIQSVKTEYPVPATSRPYRCTNQKLRASVDVQPSNTREKLHRALARSAHVNATRLTEHDTAESSLLILGRLRKTNPKYWTATGIESSTEDALLCKLCDTLDAVPQAATTHTVEELAEMLVVQTVE